MGELVAGTDDEAVEGAVGGEAGDSGEIGFRVLAGGGVVFGEIAVFARGGGIARGGGVARRLVVDGEGDGGSFAEDEGESLAESGEVIFLDPEVVDGVWDGDGDAGV